MMGCMWCDVGSVGGGLWVKWFRRSGFCVVLCVFCIEAWIDFYLLGSDGLDVAVI